MHALKEFSELALVFDCLILKARLTISNIVFESLLKNDLIKNRLRVDEEVHKYSYLFAYFSGSTSIMQDLHKNDNDARLYSSL